MRIKSRGDPPKRRGSFPNMKRNSKASTKSRIALVGLFFFLLSGCADTKWPTWISGEPSESVLRAPRAVTRPAKQKDKAWPRLGDVPTNKPDFSDPLDMRDEEEALQSDRFKGQAAEEQLRNVSLPEPIGGPAVEEKKQAVQEDVLPTPTLVAPPLPTEVLEIPAPVIGKAKPFSALLP